MLAHDAATDHFHTDGTGPEHVHGGHTHGEVDVIVGPGDLGGTIDAPPVSVWVPKPQFSGDPMGGVITTLFLALAVMVFLTGIRGVAKFYMTKLVQPAIWALMATAILLAMAPS